MKFSRLILPFVVVALLCACGVSSSVVNTSSSSKVIIAVNTSAGIGYFVDSEGKILFGKQFDHVYSFSEGLAAVEQNGKWGFINTKGEVVPCFYNLPGDFSEGLARIRQNRKYGFINTKGEVVVPCVYDDAWSFSEGLAKVEQDGKWSIINAKGEVIVAECSESTSWSVVEF